MQLGTPARVVFLSSPDRSRGSSPLSAEVGSRVSRSGRRSIAPGEEVLGEPRKTSRTPRVLLTSFRSANARSVTQVHSVWRVDFGSLANGSGATAVGQVWFGDGIAWQVRLCSAAAWFDLSVTIHDLFMLRWLLNKDLFRGFFYVSPTVSPQKIDDRSDRVFFSSEKNEIWTQFHVFQIFLEHAWRYAEVSHGQS